ncbi:ABC transporter ATP-binding protein [Vallitalea sp.]|jgi:putative ABC transport system ATP-binding protein|uniref:ABC transporter ATP-binding protein n=1 Tax=Vallitalea sp. TaxID=1882829 RepID=UPI0025D21287|nr:ABC transporter ATP-binding protein [Vallitalea sp.]MCT4687829.1 ABC transporter ATP-binding protein [Vallitalea sp.]
MSDIIEIKNLRKVYRMGNERVVALDNISLGIKKGECCCILGTSGSGKSTLLNMIAGLEKPTKGQIKIKGNRIEKMNEKQVTKFRQKNVGFVFQSYNLLPNLTALENVAMPMIFGGIPKKKREKEAKRMLTAVGLSDRLHHKPSQMSGGQQQRVSIARAFVGTPEIVFADEPTGNLDTKTTMEVMELITNIAKENNQTLIIVTHDVETSVYANRVIHVRDGLIESIDSIDKNEIESKQEA